MKPIMTTPLDRIKLISLGSVQMRTFHLTWLMFFVCFFGWFGLAPLMPIIRADLGLTRVQVGNTIIASVSSTIIARLVIGRCCDVWGPRLTAFYLLLLGSIPVMLVGLAGGYSSFLLFRLAIGVIGASFVITQFHMSLMFAAKIKGTAGAIAGGWGNLGGGVTNMLMPVICSAIVGFGFTPHLAWRYAMIVPGLMMWVIAVLYYRFTTDTPAGNFSREARKAPEAGEVSGMKGWLPPRGWLRVLADWRILALMLGYAVCFGMEITFDNVAGLYYVDNFHLSTREAGIWAGVFGAMNLFARAVGGILSDKVGIRWGMGGKGWLLAAVLLMEGVALAIFARASALAAAIGFMLLFGLFLKMSSGAVYGIVPFINEKRTGLISGVVGAGGNLGGMIFSFLFRSPDLRYAETFSMIGTTVVGVAVFVSCVRWAPERRRVIVAEAEPEEFRILEKLTPHPETVVTL
jgi:NNP family nitrate/nitrite transporter-like MFS transporter